MKKHDRPKSTAEPLETPARIEPARLEEPPEAVADLVAELASQSATLGQALHPGTAANLAGIGSIETFTIIRELHDRLAQQGKDVKAEARSFMAKAAPFETAAVGAADAPWVAVARGELGQRDCPGPIHGQKSSA